MLHNFCSESAPAHVRDFYMARLYRTPAPPSAPAQTTMSSPSNTPINPNNNNITINNNSNEPTTTSIQPSRNPDSPRSVPPPQPPHSLDLNNNNSSRSVPSQSHSQSHSQSSHPPHPQEHQPTGTTSSSHSGMQPAPVRPRPRGGDGRFVPRADEYSTANNRYSKICGWCRTTQTSQWRVGPTNGSAEMGTLCNACGINYRRALAKTPDGMLNLDKLAQQMGHTRLSIQKALKRVRKLSATPPQMKRIRAESNGGVGGATMRRSTLHLGLVQSILDDGPAANAGAVTGAATTSSVTMWEEQHSPSDGSGHMLHSQRKHMDSGASTVAAVDHDLGSSKKAERGQGAMLQNSNSSKVKAGKLALTATTELPMSFVGLPVPRAFGTSSTPAQQQQHQQHPLTAMSGTMTTAARSAPRPIPGRGQESVDKDGTGSGNGESDADGNVSGENNAKVGSWKSSNRTESVTLSPAGSERSAPSRLPPFQSFLGSLERQSGVM